MLAARDIEPLEEVAEEIRAMGRRVEAISADVTSSEQVGAMVERTKEAFGGRIDILVNVAGTTGPIETPVQDIDPDDFLEVLDINVRGTFMLSRAAVPHLRESPHARILSLSPPLNLSPRWLGAHTAYTMAKYGMTMATLGIAAEFAGAGVAATTLWPRTTIATAAVQNILGGDRIMAVSRTPEIYADAAIEVLTRPAAEVSGRSLIVEDVLAEAGVTDLSAYAAVPGWRFDGSQIRADIGAAG